MAAPATYLPTQIRRLARIVRAERKVADATAAALADLAEVVKTQLAADGYTAVVVDNRAPEWRQALTDAIMPVIADVYAEGYASETRSPALTSAAETAAERPDDRSPADRYAGQYLTQVENRLTGVADDVFRRITTALEDGRQAQFTVTGRDGVTSTETGESIQQLAARVNDLLGNEVWAKRGTVVARTEVISANNAGSQAAARDNAALFGTTEGSVIKEWLATSDTRTRETHQNANHDKVMGLHTPFSVGGASMQIPGDPAAPAREVVNCRCTALYHYPGDPDYDEMAADLGAAPGLKPVPAFTGMTDAEVKALVGDPEQGKAARRELSQRLARGPRWETLQGDAARTHAEKFLGPKGSQRAKTVHQRGQHTLITEVDLTPAQVQNLLDEAGPVLDKASLLLGRESVLVRVPEIASDTVFRRSSGALGYVTRGVNTIHLRPTLVAGNSSLIRGVDKALEQGHFMPSATGVSHVRYTVAHELGHVIDFINGHTGDLLRNNPAASAVYRKAKAAKVMSRYGRSSLQESYAEAFADWLLTDGTGASTGYQQEFGWHTHSH